MLTVYIFLQVLYKLLQYTGKHFSPSEITSIKASSFGLHKIPQCLHNITYINIYIIIILMYLFSLCSFQTQKSEKKQALRHFIRWKASLASLGMQCFACFLKSQFAQIYSQVCDLLRKHFKMNLVWIHIIPIRFALRCLFY